ncbi:MAG: 50S ribosomal protein L11 methyltransferase, partial [Calditrichia bacterium]|nr:50S ribosomal protein L11 methyltransferase [Calditrichia bacterium]
MKYKIISIKDNEKKLTDIINIVGNYFAVEGLWEKDDSWNIYLSAHVKDDEILAINNFLKKNNKNSSNEVIFEVVDYDDKNIDWNAEWKKGYKLVKITEKIYVYPSWIEVPEEMGNKTVVRIDP